MKLVSYPYFYCFLDPGTGMVLSNYSNATKPGSIMAFREISHGDTRSSIRTRPTLVGAMRCYETFLIQNAFSYGTVPQTIHMFKSREVKHPKDSRPSIVRNQIPARILNKDDHEWSILYGRTVKAYPDIKPIYSYHSGFFKKFHKRKDRESFQYLCYRDRSFWQNKNVRHGCFNRDNMVAFGDWMAVKDDPTMVMAKLRFNPTSILPMSEILDD